MAVRTLEEMIRNTTGRYHDKIKKACQPLFTHFGIVSFSYAKLTHTGYHSVLSSNPKWLEYYYAEKLYLLQPHFRHPSNFQSGISLAKNIENSEYQSISTIASEKFNEHFSVGILDRVADGLEIIGLNVNTPSKMHDLLLLNELGSIRKFLAKFARENRDIFRTLEDNQVDLAMLMGSKFQKADIPVIAHLSQRKLFLKEIGIDIPHITVRENEVLTLLLNGNSANQIALCLNLSCRTVEHYVEKLKNKLGCFSRSELIGKTRELEQLGYLVHAG
ncbi:MAG: helix-turn-helix transcriptional regulator [Verrucomicrobia bacterium]|nr:helix-turn-helix transcriptional regulator [Verrucomicrobiota bacterium]